MASKQRTAAVEPLLTAQPKKIAAFIAQLGSFTTTYLFIDALGINGAAGFIVAISVEFLLLMGKNNILSEASDSGSDTLGLASIIIDTLLNAGGIWPFVKRLNSTASWIMIAEVAGLKPDLRLFPALIVALVLGFLLAIAPHRFWRD